MFDFVIFALTAYKAYRLRRGGRLLQVLIRDGTLISYLPSVLTDRIHDGCNCDIGSMYFL